jgi:hypothetical protein
MGELWECHALLDPFERSDIRLSRAPNLFEALPEYRRCLSARVQIGLNQRIEMADRGLSLNLSSRNGCRNGGDLLRQISLRYLDRLRKSADARIEKATHRPQHSASKGAWKTSAASGGVGSGPYVGGFGSRGLVTVRLAGRRSDILVG